MRAARHSARCMRVGFRNAPTRGQQQARCGGGGMIYDLGGFLLSLALLLGAVKSRKFLLQVGTNSGVRSIELNEKFSDA